MKSKDLLGAIGFFAAITLALMSAEKKLKKPGEMADATAWPGPETEEDQGYEAERPVPETEKDAVTEPVAEEDPASEIEQKESLPEQEEELSGITDEFWVEIKAAETAAINKIMKKYPDSEAAPRISEAKEKLYSGAGVTEEEVHSYIERLEEEAPERYMKITAEAVRRSEELIKGKKRAPRIIKPR
jgi:hypothetical protein